MSIFETFFIFFEILFRNPKIIFQKNILKLLFYILYPIS